MFSLQFSALLPTVSPFWPTIENNKAFLSTPPPVFSLRRKNLIQWCWPDIQMDNMGVSQNPKHLDLTVVTRLKQGPETLTRSMLAQAVGANLKPQGIPQIHFSERPHWCSWLVLFKLAIFCHKRPMKHCDWQWRSSETRHKDFKQRHQYKTAGFHSRIFLLHFRCQRKWRHVHISLCQLCSWTYDFFSITVNVLTQE